MRHSERIKQANSNLTADQIRANKCQRSKERNVQRLTERRKEAEERQQYWDSLSNTEKIQALDKRLGVGVGAVKQRSKILLGE